MYCLRHLPLTWFKRNNLFSHWSQVNSQKQCCCSTHTSCLTCSNLVFPLSWVLPMMYCLSCFHNFWMLLWVICHHSYSYSQKLILYFDTWHSPLAHSRQLINWSWYWQSVGKKYELCGQAISNPNSTLLRLISPQNEGNNAYTDHAMRKKEKYLSDLNSWYIYLILNKTSSYHEQKHK